MAGFAEGRRGDLFQRGPCLRQLAGETVAGHAMLVIHREAREDVETFHRRRLDRCDAVAASLVGPSVAEATFPGENGRIVVRRYLNEEHTRAALFTVQASGAIDQLTHPRRSTSDD